MSMPPSAKKVFVDGRFVCAVFTWARRLSSTGCDDTSCYQACVRAWSQVEATPIRRETASRSTTPNQQQSQWRPLGYKVARMALLMLVSKAGRRVPVFKWFVAPVVRLFLICLCLCLQHLAFAHEVLPASLCVESGLGHARERLWPAVLRHCNLCVCNKT